MLSGISAWSARLRQHRLKYTVILIVILALVGGAVFFFVNQEGMPKRLKARLGATNVDHIMCEITGSELNVTMALPFAPKAVKKIADYSTFCDKACLSVREEALSDPNCKGVETLNITFRYKGGQQMTITSEKFKPGDDEPFSEFATKVATKDGHGFSMVID